MSRETLVRALGEGAAAGREKTPVSTCPYPAGDLRRTAWMRGYAKARPLNLA
ncbi:Rmf/CrpP fold protein [Streptomyces sp. NBC_00063]|uniref:Rmf/CrpP fold protein n=1 Tax=Streptomyces sp. NBC_00063 TaxID=2975638 RepID=UPI003D763FE5